MYDKGNPCLEQSIRDVVTAAAAPGYDAAHNNDGYIIIAVSARADGSLGGHTTQDVDISGTYELPFALIGCSVTMHDPTPGNGNATGHIAASATSPENPPLSGQTAFIMDLHGADSRVAGWKVEGNGRYVRNTYGVGSDVGLWFVGNNNVMHNGRAEGNTGIGIKVEGNNNTISGADAVSNGGHGVYVSGNNSGLDTIDSGDKGKGNGGNGFTILGNGNTLDQNDAFGNSGNGFFVTSTGAVNLLTGNRAGDKGKGNLKSGFLINSCKGTP